MQYRYLVFIILTFCTTILVCVNRSFVRTASDEKPVVRNYNGPEEFARFHRSIRTAEGDAGPAYTPGYRYRELRKSKATSRSRGMQMQSATVTWTERGPANVPGRTRGLIVDPDDPLKNTWYAGSAGGGVWKTTNAGAQWTLLTPDLTNLATTVLAMAASNHDILYVGTGEGFGNLDGITGNGIFKSADRGQTWTHLPATIAFSDVNRIAISPTDPDVVVAATNTGIYRTTNGGVAWTQTSMLTAIQDLKVNPSDFQIQYAAQNAAGVLKSTDGGVTWANSNAGMSPSGRVELAVSPVNTQRIFASCEGGLSGSDSDLYVSNDAGATWSLVNVQWNGAPLDFLGGQGWYDNTIACDPFNANVVYFGGVNLFRTTLSTGATEVINYTMVENNTSDFLFLLSFANIQYSFGRLTAGPDAGQRNIEIRFGPGINQMAHRFRVPAGATSGVPVLSYTYADYVQVPFQAWEVTNPLLPRQLMVSFRDQANNGQFDLVPQFFGTDALLNSREYVYINNVDYAGTPSAAIAVAGGQEHKLIYNFFPSLASGATWDPGNLPVSTINISYAGVQKLNASTITVSDAYGQFDAKNRFNTFGTDVHPDQHNLVMVPMSGSTYKILSASDGGVFVSNTSVSPGINEGNWTMSGRTYRSTQFYGADKRPGFDQYFGGTQDNGTWKSPNPGSSSETTDYDFAFGGDGFEVIWNNLDDKKMIGGSQGNNFVRSTNGGLTWSNATSGLFGEMPFISKLANSRDNPDRIYALSSAGVFFSPNFGASWTASPITDRWGGVSSLMDVEVSRANATIVWAGSGMIDGTGGRNIHVSTDAGVTFTATENPPASLISGGITKLASHPFQEQTAYALFSQAGNPKILRTMDLGQTWEDISGFDAGDVSTRGFPDVAVYCLYIRPDDPNILWAGTEIGIVESLDNGLTWSLVTGFPSLSVWDMKGMDNQVVIATHGRGIWTATVDAPQEVTAHPEILDFGTSPKEQLLLKLRAPDDYDRLEIYDGTTLKATATTVAAGDWVATLPGIAPGLRSIKLIGYRGTAPIHSKTYSIDQLDILSIENSYFTYFANLDDFTVTGFSLSGFPGAIPSERKTLHSDHPYAPNGTIKAVIRHPIIVSATLPTLFYEDVALVEPGVDGAPFGTNDFLDFAVMEASTNGLDWIPLADGYDARLHAEWNAAYTAGTPGSRSLLRQHQIDLTQAFQVGDTLLFRYRLYSNADVAGWGTAVDYITIQEEPTGLENPVKNPLSLVAYPNPVVRDVHVEFELPSAMTAVVEIVDVHGRVIQSRTVLPASSERHRETFAMAAQPAGAYFVVLTAGKRRQVAKILVSR